MTYGAHGVWSWHHHGQSFDSFIRKGAGFALPFDWHDALHFKGADDMHYLKESFEELFPEDCIPDYDVILNDMEEIRCAHDADKYVIYVPTNVELDVSVLGINKEKYTVEVTDLQTRKKYQGQWKEDTTKLQLLSCYEDALVVLRKQQ